MYIYPPKGKLVLMTLHSDEDDGFAIEFEDENAAILFFEWMKQAFIEASEQ